MLARLAYLVWSLMPGLLSAGGERGISGEPSSDIPPFMRVEGTVLEYNSTKKWALVSDNRIAIEQNSLRGKSLSVELNSRYHFLRVSKPSMSRGWLVAQNYVRHN